MAEMQAGLALDQIGASVERTACPDGFWPAVARGSGPGVWATAFAVNTLIELSPGDRALPFGIHAAQR